MSLDYEYRNLIARTYLFVNVENDIGLGIVFRAVGPLYERQIPPRAYTAYKDRALRRYEHRLLHGLIRTGYCG